MSLSNQWPPSKPYTLHLEHNSHSLGFIRGLTFLSHPTKRQPARARCHYFGGVPYAISTGRFRRPEPLSADHRYGESFEEPVVFEGEVGVCPQPGDFGSLPGPDDTREWNEDGTLQLNVWVPVGEPPNVKGWPVMVVLHGGFLSFGSPNGSDYMGLLDTVGRCVLVVPGYRVNVFGFLAGRELQEEDIAAGGVGAAGNYGLWDQRMALQWTRERIAYFGGDPENLTLLGYSAGALSAFHQMCHEFNLIQDQRMIRRVIMLANGPGMQPRSVAEIQDQYDELLDELGIPSHLPSAEKLGHLRSASAIDIVNASLRIKHHEFRHVTDGVFVLPDIFDGTEDGSLVKQFKDSGIELLLCECQYEHFAFATWHTPEENSLLAVRRRLSVDYPSYIIDAVIDEVFCPTGQLPTVSGHVCKTWYEFFGILYAELQVHAVQKGFVNELFKHGAGDRVRRCRVGWRAKRADKNFPKEMKATHGVDTALWFWGDGVGLELMKREEPIAEAWCKPYWSWIYGNGWNDWSAAGPKDVRYIDADGNISNWQDEDWDRGIKVWNVIRRIQKLNSRAID